MKPRAFKRIWGKPWDYGYLLKLEQYKIREMWKYFQKSQLTEGWELQVRDLKLCDKLISIVLEEDKYYRSWLDKCYGSIPAKDVKFPVHINTRNQGRFMMDVNLEAHFSPKVYESLKSCLRQQKALYLYNKIRAYRMEYWWD